MKENSLPTVCIGASLVSSGPRSAGNNYCIDETRMKELINLQVEISCIIIICVCMVMFQNSEFASTN
jgi:hypothetical protein